MWRILLETQLVALVSQLKTQVLEPFLEDVDDREDDDPHDRGVACGSRKPHG
jgi:hypothetical protein